MRGGEVSGPSISLSLSHYMLKLCCFRMEKMTRQPAAEVEVAVRKTEPAEEEESEKYL
jgi:hypothetical protein